MTYQISAYDADGLLIANLGAHGTIAGARQAMLDHSNTTELPDEPPLFFPEIAVIESWLAGAL